MIIWPTATTFTDEITWVTSNKYVILISFLLIQIYIKEIATHIAHRLELVIYIIQADILRGILLMNQMYLSKSKVEAFLDRIVIEFMIRMAYIFLYIKSSQVLVLVPVENEFGAHKSQVNSFENMRTGGNEVSSTSATT